MFYTTIHNKGITVVNGCICLSNIPLAISLGIYWNSHRLIRLPRFTAEGFVSHTPCRSGVCNHTPVFPGMEMKDKVANSFYFTKYRNSRLHIFRIYICPNLFSSNLTNCEWQSDPQILLMARSSSIFSYPVQTWTSQLSANSVGYGNERYYLNFLLLQGM